MPNFNVPINAQVWGFIFTPLQKHCSGMHFHLLSKQQCEDFETEQAAKIISVTRLNTSPFVFCTEKSVAGNPTLV